MIIFYVAVFGFLWVAAADELTPCTTPNGEAASCVPLLRCIVLIQAAGSNEPVALKFFRESVCDEKTSSVCCGSTGNFTKTLTTPKPLSEKEMFDGLSKEEKKNYVLKKLLPTKTYCGLQHTDDYFYNGTKTSVDEYPWLVYVLAVASEDENYDESRVEINCAGVLINNRYVLSAEYCLHYIFYGPPPGTYMYMILGVHHIYKDVNCMDWRVGVEDCTNPSLRVLSSQWKEYNGVVLFRLDEKIEYSDFIRPICLPLQADEIPTTGSLVMASGWSEEQFVWGKRFKLKKRMKYTVMSKKDCETNNLVQNAICGIPLKNNSHYLCKGDNGGPLMYAHKYININWFAVGLISQTTIGLCDEAQPAVAVQLTPERVNWIIENIKP